MFETTFENKPYKNQNFLSTSILYKQIMFVVLNSTFVCFYLTNDKYTKITKSKSIGNENNEIS